MALDLPNITLRLAALERIQTHTILSESRGKSLRNQEDNAQLEITLYFVLRE